LATGVSNAVYGTLPPNCLVETLAYQRDDFMGRSGSEAMVLSEVLERKLTMASAAKSLGQKVKVGNVAECLMPQYVAE
jgi:hypothetical protein